MSKDPLRSRKKLKKHVAKARSKDQEVEPELRKMIDGILQLCKDRDIEPETLLYHLERLTYIGRGALAKKHKAQFLGDDHDKSKKEVEIAMDDYRRLLETIAKLSVEELKGGSGQKSRPRPPSKGSSNEPKMAQNSSNRSSPLKGYA